MFNKKSVYLFLLSASLCSLFFGTIALLLVLSVAFFVILYINRGIFYTLRANKLLLNKERERGYELLRRAYLTDTVPFMVISGYIFLSLKFGYLDNAWEAINRVLNGNSSIKLKPRFKKETLNNKALYYWATNDIDSCLEIMNDLYNEGFLNSNFFGSYGCLLTINNELEKAERVINEAIDFNSNDKVSLDNQVSLFINLGKWNEAKNKWDDLKDLEPNFPEFWYHGAVIYQHLNDNNRAKELLEKAKSLPIFKLSTISEEDIKQLELKL